MIELCRDVNAKGFHDDKRTFIYGGWIIIITCKFHLFDIFFNIFTFPCLIIRTLRPFSFEIDYFTTLLKSSYFVSDVILYKRYRGFLSAKKAH